MNDLNIIIGIGGVILGFYLNYLNYRRTQDKDLKDDTKDDTKENTELKVKLDYISKGVDDIRLDIRSTNREVDDLKTRVTRVEESSKSAHHRIDGLEREE